MSLWSTCSLASRNNDDPNAASGLRIPDFFCAKEKQQLSREGFCYLLNESSAKTYKVILLTSITATCAV